MTESSEAGMRGGRTGLSACQCLDSRLQLRLWLHVLQELGIRGIANVASSVCCLATTVECGDRPDVAASGCAVPSL